MAFLNLKSMMMGDPSPFFACFGVILYFHLVFHLNVFEFLGVSFAVSVTCYTSYIVGTYIYRSWLAPALHHNTDLRAQGRWAVVTGATDGVGLAYAEQLAKLGLNIVLISRSPEKLTKVAADIEETFQVETKTIPVDLTGGLEIYEGIDHILGDLEVGILINNVAVCYPYPEHFVDLPNRGEFARSMINCNVLALTMMTSIVLPGMLARGRGVVVSVGSMACRINSPYMSLYAGTKAFVDKYTVDMGLEYRDQGVIFQSQVPGYIVTKMSKVKESSVLIPSPQEYVEAALKTIGVEDRTAVCLPHRIFFRLLETGLYLRREGTQSTALMIGKQMWIYGKKVMLYRNRRKSG